MLAGLLAALVGVGDAIKSALAAVRIGYSYFDYNAPNAYRPSCPGPPERCVGYGPPASYLDQQRSQDLVLAITLIVIGIAVLIGHHFLFRAVRGMRGGGPIWIVRGRWIAVTAVCGLIGLGAAGFAVYTTISYLILTGPNSKQPFGEPLGLAIAFLPVWAFAVTRLLRDVRAGSPGGPDPESPPAPA